MKKFELSLASDYVPGWTIVDAIRELFQNALDQEVQCPDNKAYWEYSDGTLRISNAQSSLTTKSLLLGSTSKANDAGTIGQFGEGYKVATLVLLREGKQVTFYNYGSREVWRPRFVNSRRFGAEILTFFVDTEYPWTKTPNNDLTIEVQGITPDEWQAIVESNLRLRDDYSVVASTEFGDILDIPGKVFVNGLFVCDYKEYHHSYNFLPGNLKLDRDRKLASDFDLKWLASKMWRVAKGMEQTIYELAMHAAADVAYVPDVSHYAPGRRIEQVAHESFVKEHGDNAVPVTTQWESQQVPATHRAVIVPETVKRMVVSAPSYVAPPLKEQEQTGVERLREWCDKYLDTLDAEIADELQSILEQIEEEA